MSTSDRRRIVPPSTPMKITQIAVVVRDMDTALKSYTETLGWGPWSVFDYKPPLLHDTRVRGEAVEYRMIGAETSVDGLGFELIQPVSGPSIYQEFLDSHGEGVQHIACMKHSYEDSSLVREHWHSNGAEVLMSGRIGDSIEFYYLDTAPMLKFVLESGSGHAIDLKPSWARGTTTTRRPATARPACTWTRSGGCTSGGSPRSYRTATGRRSRATSRASSTPYIRCRSPPWACSPPTACSSRTWRRPANRRDGSSSWWSAFRSGCPAAPGRRGTRSPSSDKPRRRHRARTAAMT